MEEAGRSWRNVHSTAAYYISADVAVHLSAEVVVHISAEVVAEQDKIRKITEVQSLNYIRY